MKLVKMSLIAAFAVISLSTAAFAAVVEEKVFTGGYMSSNDGNDSASLSIGTVGTIIYVTEKQGLTPKSAGEWKIEPTGQEVKIMAKIDPSDKKKLIDFKKTVLRATIVKARTDMIFDFAGQKVDLTVKLDPTTKMWNESEKSLVITGQKLHFTAKLDPAIAKLLEQHKQGFVGAKTHIISDLTGQEMQLIIKLEPMNKTWKEHEKPMLKVDARTGDRLKVKMLKYTYSPESVGTIGQGMKFEPVLRADARTSKVEKYGKGMKFEPVLRADARTSKVEKYGKGMKFEPVLRADARTDDSLKKYGQPMTPLLRADAILNVILDPIKAKTGMEHDTSFSSAIVSKVGKYGQGMKFEPLLFSYDTKTGDTLKVNMLKYAILNISLDPIKAKTGMEHDTSFSSAIVTTEADLKIFFKTHKLRALGKSQFDSGTASALIAA